MTRAEIDREWPARPKTPVGVEPVPRGRRGDRYWRFRVRWTSPVSARRPPAEFDSISEAQAFHARLRLARSRGEVAELTRGDSTVGEFVELEWWPYVGRRLERSTLRPYASVYNNHLAPHIGHLLVRRLTSPRVADLRDLLEREGVGIPTVRRALAVLQSICRRAVTVGALTFNPVREVEKPPQHRQLAIAAPTAADVEAILCELDRARDRALVAVLGYTAPRPGEALALELRHVGEATLLIEQRLVAWRSIVPGQKNARRLPRSHRSPVLHARVREAVDEHLAELDGRRGRRELLFAGDEGATWTERDWRAWTRDVFQPAAERAGVEIGRPYDLRHGAANMLLRAGMPLTEIAAHLGNSVATLSRYYTHLIAEHAGKPAIPVDQQIAAARE